MGQAADVEMFPALCGIPFAEQGFRSRGTGWEESRVALSYTIKNYRITHENLSCPRWHQQYGESAHADAKAEDPWRDRNAVMKFIGSRTVEILGVQPLYGAEAYERGETPCLGPSGSGPRAVLFPRPRLTDTVSKQKAFFGESAMRKTADRTVMNGRNPDGRFGPKNQAAAGRSSRSAHLRTVMIAAVTDKDIQEVVKAIIKEAKAGDIPAAKLLFDRVLGKPVTDEQDQRDESRNRILSMLGASDES